jgi:hypothetical protein
LTRAWADHPAWARFIKPAGTALQINRCIVYGKSLFIPCLMIVSPVEAFMAQFPTMYIHTSTITNTECRVQMADLDILKLLPINIYRTGL